MPFDRLCHELEELEDWNDIHRLVRHAAEERLPLRRDLIADYLAIFRLDAKMTELRALHDEAQ